MKFLASRDRKSYGFGESEPIDIYKVINLMEKVTILKTPLEKQTGFYKIMGEAKLMVINSNNALGRQNFTLAHELYHLKYDDSRHDYDTVEEEAEIYASYFLIPEYGLKLAVEQRRKPKEKLTISDIIFLEQFFGVSHSAFIRRLKEQKLINQSECQEIDEIPSIVSAAKKLGYSTKLYEPSKENFDINSNFLELISNLFETGRISEGRYNQYLRNNSLWEVVYGKIDDEEYE